MPNPDPSLHSQASEEARAVVELWENAYGNCPHYVVTRACECKVCLEAMVEQALDRVSRERTRQAMERAKVREGRLMKMLRDVLAHVEDETVPREGNQCTLCYSWRARIRSVLSDGESVASEER